MLSVLALILPANAQVNHISTCTLIDEPGYYVLDSDFVVNKTTCIEIRSSDVTLDGENHKITAGLFGGTYGVLIYHQAGLKNITIKNLSFENWVYGVLLRDVSKASVYNIKTKAGFFGIYFSNVKDLTLRNCRVYDVKKTGFGLEGVDDAELSNLEGKSNTENGILLSNSERILIYNSVFEDNGFGIYLKNSKDITINKCKSALNEKFGLYVYNSENVRVSGLEALQNKFDGIKVYSSKNCKIYGSNFEGNRNGIFFENTRESKVIDNTISNSENGIFVSNSKDNYFTSNELLNNKKGIVSTSSSYNLFNSNRIAGGAAISFQDTSSSTITGNWIENAERGIFLVRESQRNLIYLNSIFADRNAYDEGKENLWFSPELKKGNYYSDYKGSDAYGDGIGDQDYIIPPKNVKDIYPSMSPISAEKKEVIKEEKETSKKEIKETNTPLPSPEQKVEESMIDFYSFEFLFGIGALIVIATLVALLIRDKIL
jgi:parallel beta-helix repeat protein